jgi:uncharacterized protein YecE (DUF72 family)
MAQLFSGTSGFAYPSWKPGFYPAKLPAKDFLRHYAGRLNSTEINYTFRQLPKTETLKSWVEATPDHFIFSLKAHMRLTHIMKLKDTGSFLEVFFRAIDPLRSARRLGPVLYQLPPTLRCDVSLLSGFLELLPSDLRHAFEFRHASWLDDSVYAALEKHGAALCLAESEKLVVPPVMTADFVYTRLRKPDYSEEDRAAIAGRSREILSGGRDLYVYFKHEETPDGALYAEELVKALADPSR